MGNIWNQNESWKPIFVLPCLQTESKLFQYPAGSEPGRQKAQPLRHHASLYAPLLAGRFELSCWTSIFSKFLWWCAAAPWGTALKVHTWTNLLLSLMMTSRKLLRCVHLFIPVAGSNHGLQLLALLLFSERVLLINQVFPRGVCLSSLYMHGSLS